MIRLSTPFRPKVRTGPGIQTRVELGEPRFVRNWVAVDLGQAADYTAILSGQTLVAVERTLQKSEFAVLEHVALERPVTYFRVTNMHRPRLGTPYPIVARQIAAWIEMLPDADLICDSTGVGRGVIDILRAQNLYPVALSITAGAEVNAVSKTDLRVPKVELVSSLVAASQEGRLRIAPELPLCDVLVQEIASFTPRRTASGSTTFEASAGNHDDLVIALAMAVWHQGRPQPRPARMVQSSWIER